MLHQTVKDFLRQNKIEKAFESFILHHLDAPDQLSAFKVFLQELIVAKKAPINVIKQILTFIVEMNLLADEYTLLHFQTLISDNFKESNKKEAFELYDFIYLLAASNPHIAPQANALQKLLLHKIYSIDVLPENSTKEDVAQELARKLLKSLHQSKSNDTLAEELKLFGIAVFYAPFIKRIYSDPDYQPNLGKEQYVHFINFLKFARDPRPIEEKINELPIHTQSFVQSLLPHTNIESNHLIKLLALSINTLSAGANKTNNNTAFLNLDDEQIKAIQGMIDEAFDPTAILLKIPYQTPFLIASKLPCPKATLNIPLEISHANIVADSSDFNKYAILMPQKYLSFYILESKEQAVQISTAYMQETLPELPGNDALEKSIKDTAKKIVSNAAALTAFLNIPSSNLQIGGPSFPAHFVERAISASSAEEEQDDKNKLNSVPRQMKYKMHMDTIKNQPIFMQAIAGIETSGGLNTEHPTLERGMHKGTSAIGYYGIMPIQMHETIKKDKALSSAYGHLLQYDPVKDQDRLHDAVADDINLHHALAASHYNKLKRIFKGDESRMAYAWHHGISAALKASDDQVANSPYVQKYHRHKEAALARQNKEAGQIKEPPRNASLDLQIKKNANLGVFEIIKRAPAGSYNYEFKLDTPNPSPKLVEYVKEVNNLLKNGAASKIHNKGAKDLEFLVLKHPNEESEWLVKMIIAPSKNIANTLDYELNNQFLASVLATHVFHLENHVPVCLYGKIVDHSFSPAKWVKALFVKLPKHIQPLKNVHNNFNEFWHTMNEFKERGIIHKIAAFLYIIGDIDAHGGKFLVGDNLYSIKHENSMTGSEFDDPELFVRMPYILRVFKRRENDLLEPSLPLIESTLTQENLKNWLYSINIGLLTATLKDLGVEEHVIAAITKRYLKMIEQVNLQVLSSKGFRIDKVVNNLWDEQEKRRMTEE